MQYSTGKHHAEEGCLPSLSDSSSNQRHAPLHTADAGRHRHAVLVPIFGACPPATVLDQHPDSAWMVRRRICAFTTQWQR